MTYWPLYHRIPPPPDFSQNNINLNIGEKSIPYIPYEFLNEWLKDKYYDYILVSGNENYVLDNLKKLGIEKRRIFNMASTFSNTPLHLTYHTRLIRQIMSNLSSYVTLFVGSSYTRDSVDLTCYDLPAVSCSSSSQDLYYSYKYVKFLLSKSNNNFKYVMIELSPYSFHYDLSKSNESYIIPGYYLAFKDVHNFYISAEELDIIFNEQYLKLFETFEKINYPFDLDLNDLYKWKQVNNHPMNVIDRFVARERAEIWNHKRFPDTVAENVKILNECIQFCHKNNVIPTIVIYPKSYMYRKFFSKQMLDEFYYILNGIKMKYKLNVLDYLEWTGVDYNDFYNVDHLNANGSKKISKVINSYIMRNYTKN